MFCVFRVSIQIFRPSLSSNRFSRHHGACFLSFVRIQMSKPSSFHPIRNSANSGPASNSARKLGIVNSGPKSTPIFFHRSSVYRHVIESRNKNDDATNDDVFMLLLDHSSESAQHPQSLFCSSWPPFATIAVSDQRKTLRLPSKGRRSVGA